MQSGGIRLFDKAQHDESFSLSITNWEARCPLSLGDIFRQREPFGHQLNHQKTVWRQLLVMRAARERKNKDPY